MLKKINKHYSKTPGFKMFGKDWVIVYELCLEQMEYASYESQLIRKILHVGHKLSQPLSTEDHEGYMLIIKDLHRRVAIETKHKEEVEALIEVAFDELVQQQQFKSS
jgi:hypothetical protein